MHSNPLNEVFTELKTEGLRTASIVRKYPKSPFPYEKSPLYYWGPELSRSYRSVLSSDFVDTSASGVYLELGSFFGCGSTQDVLQHTEMQCICVDNFSIPYRWWKHNKGPEHRRPNSAVPGLHLNQMPFFKGQGTHLDHFMHNTWEYRDRVVPVQCDIEPEILDAIYDAGVVPDLVFIDDDHSYAPLRWRLAFVREHWPSAVVVCDDYKKQNWPGVVEAVDEALEMGLYDKAKSKELAERLYLLRN